MQKRSGLARFFKKIGHLESEQKWLTEKYFFRYCDRVCNTTDCMFDGGDCLGDQPRFGFADSDEIRPHWTDSGDLRPTCAASCLDNWLADKWVNNEAFAVESLSLISSKYQKLFGL